MDAKNKRHCRKCGAYDLYRIPRGWAMKKLFFFLPLKRYKCAKCQRGSYRINN